MRSKVPIATTEAFTRSMVSELSAYAPVAGRSEAVSRVALASQRSTAETVRRNRIFDSYCEESVGRETTGEGSTVRGS